MLLEKRVLFLRGSDIMFLSRREGMYVAVIGIDLGTTNSLACIWKEGKCVIIPNRFH